ncbi:hypothetical protein QBC35DRAFT_482259 [Podospora australis]|uniref:U4/U6.U5 small nuclear ribonucleoprotein 27kDa protein domain-containing protein n=1 Tax=Podospora australis TaxID=1536484 RepID=A0AAN6X3J0_9PEZI|nr:hypothetical protein QBC35DRAFT_482259 [Podospora australis]
MSDRRGGGGYSSRRGGDRSHHDNRDRHRDRDYDRGHDRRKDRDGDQDRRSRDHGRDRDREKDRDHTRYRSRSRDREGRDRRRSRSPRESDRRDGRDRDYRRRDDGRTDTRDRTEKKEDPKRLEREVVVEKPVRDEGPPPRRPRVPSPRRSESPNRGFDREIGEKDTHLPTRSKPSTNVSTPTAPVSFKVKGRDGSHGPERPISRGARSDNQDDRMDQDDEHHPSRTRFDADPMDEDEEDDVVVEDDGLGDMAAMMGFGGFGSTKGKKVLGNNVGAVKKEKKTEYRQYMNRVGGFNRPLSPPR